MTTPKIFETSVEELHVSVVAREWGNRSLRYETRATFVGAINLDPRKPVYIMQEKPL